MMLVTFNAPLLGQAVRERTKKYGARQELMRETGIPTGSLQRLIDGNASNIDNILSVCKYYGWDIQRFTEAGDGRRIDRIIV